MKQLLNKDLRAKVRLSEIERLIKRHRIIVPPPSRSTLLKMCEAGILETAGDRPTKWGWLVYEDSFINWARSLDRARSPRKK